MPPPSLDSPTTQCLQEALPLAGALGVLAGTRLGLGFPATPVPSLAAVPTPAVPGALVPAAPGTALDRPAALQEQEVPGRHRGRCTGQRLEENTKNQACAKPGEGINESGGAARRKGWAMTGGRRPWSLRSLSTNLLHFRCCFQPAMDEISACVLPSKCLWPVAGCGAKPGRRLPGQGTWQDPALPLERSRVGAGQRGWRGHGRSVLLCCSLRLPRGVLQQHRALPPQCGCRSSRQRLSPL